MVATIGHAGRRSRLADRGVVATFGGERWEETAIVRRYTDRLDFHLRELGHSCILLSDGEYREQWARADGVGADVYLACHINAGGGNRGEFFFDHRSTAGAALASAIVEAAAKELPWPCFARNCQPDTNGKARDGDYTEAYNCISGVKAVALCCEPGFIDGPHGARLIEPEIHDAIGEAIARGIHTWGLHR